jgi:hypothetical protein
MRMERSITFERDKRQRRKNLPVSPGGISEWVPPDPISNSEVKTLSADGSVPLGMPE